MRQHNGVILVTEPVVFTVMALSGTLSGLPDAPTGDLGRDVKQVTLRNFSDDWEWTMDGQSETFPMAEKDILVLPVRDQAFLAAIRVRGAGTLSIIYEC